MGKRTRFILSYFGVVSVGLMALLAGTSSARGALYGAELVTSSVTPGAGANGTYAYSITLDSSGIGSTEVYVPLLGDPATLIEGTPTMSGVSGLSVGFAQTVSAPGWQYTGSPTYGDFTDDFQAPPWFMVFQFDSTSDPFTINFDSPYSSVNAPYQAVASGGTSWAIVDPPTPIPEPAVFVALLVAGLALTARRFRR